MKEALAVATRRPANRSRCAAIAASPAAADGSTATPASAWSWRIAATRPASSTASMSSMTQARSSTAGGIGIRTAIPSAIVSAAGSGPTASRPRTQQSRVTGAPALTTPITRVPGQRARAQVPIPAASEPSPTGTRIPSSGPAASYEEFTREHLLSDPNVRGFTTYVVLRRMKSGLALPIE
jgi:hypothetical protein